MTLKNRSASVRARLLSKAREKSVDYQLVLTRYALERLLYRLAFRLRKSISYSKAPCFLIFGMTSHCVQLMTSTY